MGLEDYKITDGLIDEYGVVSQPDILTGTAKENKAVFDKLTRGPVTNAVNALIDNAGELQKNIDNAKGEGKKDIADLKEYVDTQDDTLQLHIDENTAKAQADVSSLKKYVDQQDAASLSASTGGAPVDYYGATGDGVTDDSAAINEAVQKADGAPIRFNAGKTYIIEEPIILVDNTYIDLCGATLKSVRRTDIGQYTNCIFIGDGVKNITIKNGTLDSACTSSEYSGVDDMDKISNAMKFTDCDGITLKEITCTNFISNTSAVPTEAYRSGFWAHTFMLRCKNVLWEDCKLTNSAIEGWFMWECEVVRLNRCYTYNKSMSTPISCLFCKSAKIHDTRIYEDMNRGRDAGSSLNWYCQDSEISGCYIEGGTMVDIGNESHYPDERFEQTDLNIHDNVLKVPINVSSISSDFQFLRRIHISNNVITNERSYGIRVGHAEGVHISGNTLSAPVCVRVMTGENVKDMIVSNNIMNGVYGLRVSVKQSDVLNLSLINNTCEAYSETNPATGQGSFLFIDGPDADGTEKVENIVIKGNTIHCSNTWVGCSLQYVGNVDITDNTMTGNEWSAEETNNDLIARGIWTPGKIQNLYVRRNIFSCKGSKILSVTGGNTAIVEDNIVTGLSETTEEINLFNFSGEFTGYVRCKSNITDGGTNVKVFCVASGMVIPFLFVGENVPDTVKNGYLSTRGPSTMRPAKPCTMASYYDTGLKKVIFWSGKEWVDGNSVTV